MRLYREFLEHSVDGYWRRLVFSGRRTSRGIDVPSLTMTGWFDGDQPGRVLLLGGSEGQYPIRAATS